MKSVVPVARAVKKKNRSATQEVAHGSSKHDVARDEIARLLVFGTKNAFGKKVCDAD
jgi:hypothetical protein